MIFQRTQLTQFLFSGHYEPPECDFDTVRINLTVTSKGRQFDRLALMYLGDTEVFRTSTAEPTANGIVWTYIKEMSQYNSLWKQPQKLIFDLGNIVNNIYTGPFSVTLTAYFSYEGNVQTADLILPISARNSASNSPSFFQLPSGNATVLYKIPATASRAIVSISACGQAEEEFWWSNVFSSDTETFKGTVGELYGFSPFREVQLYIDGILAGVVWPFPIIFTGGVAPGFWRPIVGIDAFDLRQPEIDVSPFLPLLTDGQDHSFEIKVVGLEVAVNGTATLSSSVGSYWVVTGNIFLYLDEDTSYSAADRSIPKVVAPVPKLITTRNLVQSQTGANESLSYSVVAERTLSVTSSHFSWSQALSCSNFGLLNQKGFSQENEQKTSGKASAVPIGANANPSHVGFVYPLYVNTTYGDTDTGMTIDATMKRGLDIVATGPTGISTYTLTSGPLSLHTKQSGKAHYESITGGSSTSSGDTTDDFESSTGGISYHRHVRAINGNVVLDTDSGSRSSSPVIYQEPGRNSVRSILGRGPSGPLGSY